MSNVLTSAAIRAWMVTSEGRQVSTGMSSELALELAKESWEDLVERGDSENLICLGVDLPDVLHALAVLLQNRLDNFSPTGSRAIQSVQELIEINLQSFADESEGHHLAARFAYLAWRANHQLGAVRELRRWEERCAIHVEAQPDAGAFLKLSLGERTEGLSRRFLMEPTMVLAICRSFCHDRNRAPARVALEAEAIHGWLSTHGSFLGVGDQSMVCGDLAISLGTALRHLGRYREAEIWADRSAAWVSQTPNAEPLLAKVELLRVIILFDKHMHVEALSRIPALMASFERFGMSLELTRCRLVHALLLKDLGSREEALNLLIGMQSASEVHDDPLVHGLTLSNIGEILSSQGHFEAGLPFLSAAVPLFERAATPWAFANLQATIAETLRERTDIAGAIAAYRRAISIYAAEGMDGKAGYLRVVLAQLLSAAGRDVEAIQELLVALSLFEREAITPDAMAAVALLRESLRRQKTDPEALTNLRLQIQKMKEVEQ